MIKFEKYGDFVIYVDGEFVMRVHCFYGDVLNFIWPIHFDYPDASVEIRVDDSADFYNGD